MIDIRDIENFEREPGYWEKSPHNVRRILYDYRTELRGNLDLLEGLDLRSPDNLMLVEVKEGWEALLSRVEALLEKDPLLKRRAR